MGPPLRIINETKQEYISGTGTRFHDSQLAHALSVFFTLLKSNRWQQTDVIYTENVGYFDGEDECTLASYTEVCELGNDDFDDRKKPFDKGELGRGYDRFLVDMEFKLT